MQPIIFQSKNNSNNDATIRQTDIPTRHGHKSNGPMCPVTRR